LPGGIKVHHKSKVLEFTWRDLGTKDSCSTEIYLDIRKLLPGIYLEGVRDTENLLSRYFPEGTEKHSKAILPASGLRE
jgi:hypothetical protein